MTDVYDINTGKKLATLNNRRNEAMKKAQRDYNELMSHIVDSMAFSTEHKHIKKLADSVKDKNTFVLSDFRGGK